MDQGHPLIFGPTHLSRFLLDRVGQKTVHCFANLAGANREPNFLFR